MCSSFVLTDMECASPIKEMPKLSAASISALGASPTVSGVQSNVSTPHLLGAKPRANSQHLSTSPPSLLGPAGASPLSAAAVTAAYQPPLAAAAAAAAATATRSPGGLARHDLPNSILQSQQPLPLHNTIRKTKSDMKVINRFLASKGEERDVCEMPVEELNAHLQDFILNARKKDNNDYEPESLKAFIHSLERHLKVHVSWVQKHPPLPFFHASVSILGV